MENYVKATPTRRNHHYSLNTIAASNQEKCHNARRCSSSTSKQPPMLNNSKLSALPLQVWKTHGDTDFENHQYLMKSVHQNTIKKLVKEQCEMTKPEDPIYHSSQNDVGKVKNDSQSNFWSLHSTLTLPDVECGSEEITKPQSSSSSIYSINSSTRNSVLLNPVGYQLPVNVYEEVYYQMKQLQHLTHHVEKLGKMIETVQWKHCDMHIKLLQEKETEIQELKVLLNRQKHELRQQWKTQENEVQKYGTRRTDDAPLLQAQLLKTSTMQAEISEAHQKNEYLQTAIEEFQCINEQFSSTNVDVDAQLNDFKTKNINLQEMHAKKQPTVADLTKINYKYWSQMSKAQESIINLKTAIDEVKEDNIKLQLMISELHLKHEQIHPIIVDAFVENKLCNKVDAGSEDQELHLRILKLHEQNNQLKTMIMDLAKKQSCQETLYSQIQDSISQFQDIMEKLQKGNKHMQATISELDEKKYQFEDLASGLQRNIVKLQTAIPHCVQICAFSELQNMKEENLKLQFENWELQAKISELCKSKHSFEISLSALKARVFQLETKSNNQKLQYRVFNLQDKSNEYINTIIKLECENIILQKKYSDLQGYKKQLLTIISELQSKALKLEGVELQNKQLQFFVTDLLRRNSELNIKINEFAEKNNSLEEYLLQVQQNVTHHQITNVALQGYTRPQIRIAEASGSKYQFEASSSELQTVLDILEVTGTMKERLQVSISEHQEHILEAQDNILKLHRSINSLHQLIIELQKYNQQFSLSVLELQDKICMSDSRKAQNQCVPVICQGKKSYNEGMVCIPELEIMLESPFTRLPTSTEYSLIHIILKVIKVSKYIELSIEKIGIETKHLQASFFDLEAKIIKMQLHKDGWLNSEEGTLQEIVQQLKERKHTLEKHEDEKALLKQKIFELDERLAKEKSFSNKVEAQIQNQQQAANSEIKKLQKSLKDLLSNNMKLEKTINWTLEHNGALGVKLDTLKNILIEEQVQFSEKEIKLSYQWQIHMNQIECLQGMLSEVVTENTDLKETVKILDQEKAHLQATVSELQSKLKSEKLNIKIQQDDELHAKSSSSRQYEKIKTMEENIKLTRSMEEFEGVRKRPGNTMDKLKTKLTEENLPFDKKGSQIKSEEKATDRDGNSCPEAIIQELVDKSDKDCEMHVTIEKAESMVDHVNSEINVPLTDEILFCMGSETSDMPNQSILDVFKNSHMLKMANELMEYNKQLKAYIGNVMEERYLLTAMASELKKKVTKLQQQVDKSELQMINTLCKDIPTIIDPVESENKQLFDHKNVLDNIVNKLEKKTSRDEFNCSGPAVQMEIQKDAENNQLKNKVKDLLKKNEDLKMSIKKHENEEKLLETILIEKENILSVGQKNACEIQSQMKYKIQLLENQKCQVENMVNDLLDGSITLAVDVDKILLQLTEDEMDSDLKKQHDFSELQAKIVEPEGKTCEIIEVQDEAKKLEEAKRQYKLIEKYGVEKECLTKSLLKFKLLLKNQQIYCRTSADLTSEIKEANTKIQQLQEKLNALTYNSSKLQEIDNKSREESQFSNICNSEGRGSKSLSMEPEHLRWNITSSNCTGQHSKNYLEDRKYLKSYVQPLEENNGSKILNLQNITQLEAIKELQDSNKKIQNAMEKTEREKKMLELNETHHIERLDTEQYTSNKLTVYLKNKCKILANQNNYLQDTITELLNDITAFQVLIDNLERERKLLMTKITELNDEMKINETCCNEKAKQGNLPKTTDLQNKLKGPENINTNLQAATADVDRDKMPPAIIITNFSKNNECQTSQPTGIEIDNHHIIETDDELQDRETRCQQTIDNTENSRILLNETTSNLQDKILEEHNVSIALLKNSQIYSENVYQQKLKKNPPENPHLHNEEEKVKFIDSEPKEEKMTLNKILFQPDGQEDFTWTVQEKEMVDVALENLSGEASIPEVSTFSLESPISENQQRVHETKRTIMESQIINEAINNFQDRNQQAKEKNFSTSTHLCIADEEDLYTFKTNCQCDINRNCTEPEVENTWLQETTESINNIEDLKIGNIMMKKETLLAGDSKLQPKVREELGDTEKPTSICANEAPVLYICQQEKGVTLSKRIQEPNGVTLNHQEDKDLLKVTLNDQETELSEEEFKNEDYIDQSLSIKPMAVFTEFKEPTSSDSEQITGNSEPQKDDKTVEAADTDLALKMESTLIEEDINSLNSMTSEEITAQEMLEKENNKSTPSLWMKCMMQ